MKNLRDLEQQLATATARAEQVLAEQQNRARAAGRERTPTEIEEVETLVREARALRVDVDRARVDQAITNRVAQLTNGITPQRANAGGGAVADVGFMHRDGAAARWGSKS